MGSNRYNKLNLNSRLGFFANVKKHMKVGCVIIYLAVSRVSGFMFQDDVYDVLIPTCLKPFPSRVVDVSLGPRHSGGIDESSYVFFDDKQML